MPAKVSRKLELQAQMESRKLKSELEALGARDIERVSYALPHAHLGYNLGVSKVFHGPELLDKWFQEAVDLPISIWRIHAVLIGGRYATYAFHISPDSRGVDTLKAAIEYRSRKRGPGNIDVLATELLATFVFGPGLVVYDLINNGRESYIWADLGLKWPGQNVVSLDVRCSKNLPDVLDN